jgi:oligopeptide/dipeptide ABC transporter ATP-binding protein
MTEEIKDSRLPAISTVGEALSESSVLNCEDVVQEFRVRRAGSRRRVSLSAVAGVSFEVARGETFAIVGETGSGKSTLARAIIRAPVPRQGHIFVSGQELTARKPPANTNELVQMIFQDPFSALDPKWSVEKIVGEPLTPSGKLPNVERRRTIADMLDRVGLSPNRFASRQPHELSGGQAQRVAIARALVCSPDLVICDEPVTSLDVSIQAQILNLLLDLKEELRLTYLLIAHDLALVRLLADRTATMYLGKFCEIGDTAEIFETPGHPYTAALHSAIPPRPGETTSGDRIRLLGEPPSPISPPSGCRFHTRCIYAQEICTAIEPEMVEVQSGRRIACHFPLISAR